MLTVYVGRTILRTAVMVWMVATVTFFVVRALPGNPVDVYIQQLVTAGASIEEAVARASTVLHIDLSEPLALQYLAYLGNLATGNLGESAVIAPGTPVLGMIMARLPWTLFSVGVPLVLAFFVGLRLGTVAAYRRKGKVDNLLTTLSAVGDSIPAILLGIALIFVLGVVWKVVPLDLLRGAYNPATTPGFNLPFIRSVLAHAAVPGLVYFLTSVGGWLILMRSSAISVLGEDYVTSARARGLKEHRIRSAYVRRNARLPLVVGFAITLGFVVSGAVLIEAIFIYPGVGQLLATALSRLDYTVMQGVVIVTTLTVLVATALADALYGWLDPRLRSRSRS
jgi:peptide/nickel transport system permease protein